MQWQDGMQWPAYVNAAFSLGCPPKTWKPLSTSSELLPTKANACFDGFRPLSSNSLSGLCGEHESTPGLESSSKNLA